MHLRHARRLAHAANPAEHILKARGRLNVPFLFATGLDDAWPMGTVQALLGAERQTNNKLEVYVYPGAKHGYMQPLYAAGANLDETAGAATWATLTAFLDRHVPVTRQHAVGDVWTIAEVDGGTGGLEVGKDGDIYSSDFGASLSKGPAGTKVFRITPAGEVSVFADGLRGASGNTFDTAGNFLQSNIASNTVTVIQPDGERREVVTKGLANPGF